MGAIRAVLLAVLVVVVVAGAAIYLVLRQGLSADRAPGRIETAVARRLVRLSIPASQRAMSNPHAADEQAWRAGADHFADHCAVCHGDNGRGRSEIGGHMYPPVPDLGSADVQQLSDGALFAIIQHGVRWTGMPAFESEHSADETWNLVSFIRHVPDLKPEDMHSDTHASERPDAHEHAPNHIDMDGTSFVPPVLTVKAGATVTWTNKDPFPHNVTSTAGGFKSGDLDPDQQWQFTPATPGRFPYVCTLHPGMKGTLVVEP